MSGVTAFPSRDRSPSSSPPIIQPIPEFPTKTILDYLAATGLSAELTEAGRSQFV